MAAKENHLQWLKWLWPQMDALLPTAMPYHISYPVVSLICAYVLYPTHRMVTFYLCPLSVSLSIARKIDSHTSETRAYCKRTAD
jgi:hypothetical protein